MARDKVAYLEASKNEGKWTSKSTVNKAYTKED